MRIKSTTLQASRGLSAFFKLFRAKNIFRIQLIFFSLTLLAPVQTMANGPLTYQGKEFVFSFLPSPVGLDNQALYLNIVAEEATLVTIEFPVGKEIASFMVPPNQAYVASIDEKAADINQWQNSKNGLADSATLFRVSGDKDFTCTLVNFSLATTGGATALPVAALNKYYVVSTFQPQTDSLEPDKSLFTVFSPYDSTIVKITPSNPLDFGIAEEGEVFEVRLDAGQGFLAVSREVGLTGDLTGTIVRANHPIGVINGNLCTKVPPDTGNCDHVVEFAQPVHTWGTEILLPDFSERRSGSVFSILASAPQTNVKLDGVKISTLLKEGNFYKTNIKRDSTEIDPVFHIIEADKPVFVNMFYKSPKKDFDVSGDPAMINLPPIEQFFNKHRFSTTQKQASFADNFVTLFVNKNDLDDVTLFDLENDEDFGVIAQEFTSISGTNFSAANILIPTSTFRTETPSEHSAFVWGYSNDNAYFYPAGGQLEFINQHQDTDAPEIRCFFNPDSMHAVVGVFWDNRISEDLNDNGILDMDEDGSRDDSTNGRLDVDSGIWKYEVIASSNVVLTVDEFIPGDSTVGFHLRLANMDASGFAKIRVFDMSGNDTMKTIIVPECTVDILSPTDGAITLNQEIDIVTAIQFDGLDITLFDREHTINDAPITGDFAEKDTITVPFTLQPGKNRIILKSRYTLKDTTNGVQAIVCADTIFVERVDIIRCALKVISPQDSICVTDSTITVLSEASFNGGKNVTTSCFVFNHKTNETVSGVLDGVIFKAQVALQLGWNELSVICKFTDDLNQDTTCAINVDVLRIDSLQCEIKIVSPAADTTIAAETVDIQVSYSRTGGKEPYADTVSVNGIEAELDQDSGLYVANVPLMSGDNPIVAVGKSGDGSGFSTTCIDMITIRQAPVLQCDSLVITSPEDSVDIIDSVVTIEGNVSFSGGDDPTEKCFGVNLTANDTILFTVQNGQFEFDALLVPGWNDIEVVCTATDTLDQTATCRDTVRVFRVDSLICSLTIEMPAEGDTLTGKTVEVKVRVDLTGGKAPFADTVWVTTPLETVEAVFDEQSGLYIATVTLQDSVNQITAKASFSDAADQTTMCEQTIEVFCVPEIRCSIIVTSHQDGDFVVTPTVVVSGRVIIEGGEPPYTRSCAVNGQTFTPDKNDGSFSVEVPISTQDNMLMVSCTIKDNQKQTTMCLLEISINAVDSVDCEVDIVTPDSICVSDSEIEIAASAVVFDGVMPYDSVMTISGVETVRGADSLFRATVPLNSGWNEIIAVGVFTDSLKISTTCRDTIYVQKIETLECVLTIESPGDTVTNKSAEIKARIEFTGGKTPFFGTLKINDVEAQLAQDDDTTKFYTATITLQEGDNPIAAKAEFADSSRQKTMCMDSINVFCVPELKCAIEITSPADGAFVTAPTIIVEGKVTVMGGVPRYNHTCDVNGMPFTPENDGTFAVEIPVSNFSDQTVIKVSCKITDSQPDSTECEATVTIFKPEPLSCEVTIESPRDSLCTVASKIEVAASAKIFGGLAPFDSVLTINDLPTMRHPDSLFRVTVPLEIGWNEIIAKGIFTDAINQDTTCSDTIRVFRADTLECILAIESPAPNDTLIGQSVEVRVKADVTGGAEPISGKVTVETPAGVFDAEFDETSGLYFANVDLVVGDNLITATGEFTDACDSQQTTTCSVQITVRREPPLECFIEITSPPDSIKTDDNEIEVSGIAYAIDGAPPIVSSTVTINGSIDAPLLADSTFTATVPLTDGWNKIMAVARFEDSAGQKATCADTIHIFKNSIQCTVQITQPDDSAFTKQDSVEVIAVVQVTSGVEPIDSTLTINGVEVKANANGEFRRKVALELGENMITASGKFIDAFLDSTACADMIIVTRVLEPECNVTIITPVDSVCILAEQVEVEVSASASQGLPPYSSIITVNDLEATVGSDGVFRAIVPLVLDFNNIIAKGLFVDALGCSTMCMDTIVVQRIDSLSCQVTITSHQNGDSVATDKVLVTAQVEVFNGKAPFDISCKINGEPAAPDGNGVFSAEIMLNPGDNFIEAICDISDAADQQTTCSQTIKLVLPKPPLCEIAFISPMDSAFACADSVSVVLVSTIDDSAVAPVQKTLTINGETVAVASDTVKAVVHGLLPGDQGNEIIAICTITDGLGRTATSADTLLVFSDPTPPLCELDFSQHSDDSATVKGKFWDDESGIFSVEIIQLVNRNIVFDPWEPGDREVSFVSKRTGRQGGTALDLLITNGAGCTIICDPVAVRLSPDEQCEVNLEFPEYDIYLRVENNGLHKIKMVLNGRKILLDATKAGDDVPGEVYYIPLLGDKLIDWGDYLIEGQNEVELKCEGPPGSYADLLIVNFPLTGSVYSDLPTGVEEEEALLSEIVPETFALMQNYPNPFNPETTIAFDVPAGWSNPVSLYIYNTNGQIVRRLIDRQIVSPGGRKVTWDARDDFGRLAATGIYLYRLVSGNIVLTRKLVLTK